MPVPTMAFAMPPPVSPTGLGIWIKKSRLRAEIPWISVYENMRTRGVTATRRHAIENTSMALFFVLRQKKYSFSFVVMSF